MITERHRLEVFSTVCSKCPIAILSMVLSLGGCSTLTFEPDRAGARNECATDSANLPMYNDCIERVDTFYDDYELHRKQAEEDGE